MKKNTLKKGASKNQKFLKVNEFLKIVSDENRLKILLALKEKRMNVTEIHKKLKLPQNLASHHISKLKRLGLLVQKREGTFRHYNLNIKKIKEFTVAFEKLLGI